MTPTEQDKELREQLRNIIKAPMRSKISTADIAVGMWSSTMLSEKLNDIVQLITADRKQVKEAQLDLLDRLEKSMPKKQNPIVDYSPDYTSGYNWAVGEINDAIQAERAKLEEKL